MIPWRNYWKSTKTEPESEACDENSTGNRFDAAVINRQLEKLIIDVRQVIYDMYEEGNIDIDAITARLKAKRKPAVAFLDFVEKRKEIRKYGNSPDSQERYERFWRFIQEYGKFRTFILLKNNAKHLEV